MIDLTFNKRNVMNNTVAKLEIRNNVTLIVLQQYTQTVTTIIPSEGMTDRQWVERLLVSKETVGFKWQHVTVCDGSYCNNELASITS